VYYWIQNFLPVNTKKLEEILIPMEASLFDCAIHLSQTLDRFSYLTIRGSGSIVMLLCGVN